MYKRLDGLHKDMSKYFAFDANKYTIEEFFGDLKTFKDGLQRAIKENIKLKETQAKIQRAKEAKEKAEREKKEKKARQKALLDMTTGQFIAFYCFCVPMYLCNVEADNKSL